MLLFFVQPEHKKPKEREDRCCIGSNSSKKNEFKEPKSIRNCKTYQTCSDAYSESGDKFDKRARRGCFHSKK